MAFERNDIVNKNRLMSGLGEELMGYEHNDIVTVDVMNKAIEEGGGGGGDITEASVTVTNSAPNSFTIYAPMYISNEEFEIAIPLYEVGSDDTVQVNVMLYKGMAVAEFIDSNETAFEFAVTGECEVDEENANTVKIMGAGTITVTVA